jgi:hypothetical protein
MPTPATVPVPQQPDTSEWTRSAMMQLSDNQDARDEDAKDEDYQLRDFIDGV